MILIVTASYCVIVPGNSTPDTEISVINTTTSDNNFEFNSNKTSVGDRFNATIMVYDVADLWAYQVLMNISDTLLNITNAWLPIWDLNWVFYGETSIQPAPAFYDDNNNNISESVKVGDTLLFGSMPFFGDGLLAIIEFEIIFAPTEGSVACDLIIFQPDTYLLNSELTEIDPLMKTDGKYNYLDLPPGESIISIIVNPPEQVVFGENITITGSIIRPQNNVTVTIQYKLNVTGAAWQNLTKVQTDSDGQYSYTWETSEAGEFNLKSLWEGDNVTSWAESRIVLLWIKYQSTISLNASPTNVTAGSIVVVSGTITPTPLASANATVQIRLNGTEIWKDLGDTPVVNGIYSYNWVATKRNETIVADPIIRSLSNNTFEFKAKWDGDLITNGSESQPQYPTVMVHKTTLSITINVNPQTVERYMNVTISGSVQPAISNLRLTLEYSTTPLTAPGGGIDLPGVEVYTKIDGTYNVTWNVGKFNRTDYFLYAYARSSDDVFGTKDYLTVQPAQLTIVGASSNITISVNPSEVNIGAQVIISGRIEPAREGKKVYMRIKGSGIETSVGDIYSDAEGHYSYTWKAGNFSGAWAAGSIVISVEWRGDDDYLGAKANATLMVIRNSTSLTLHVDSETITLGSNFTITGTLTPANASINIAIYYKNATGQWILLTTVPTDSAGNFSYIWAPTLAGEYQLYANWTGNAIDAPAESQIITLKVESPFTIFTYLPYIAVGIIIVVAVVLAYLYLKKKKTP